MILNRSDCMKIELKNKYTSVLYNSVPSFGGRQNLSPDASVSGYGCGLVGVADILYYLCHYNTFTQRGNVLLGRNKDFLENDSAVVDSETYNHVLAKLNHDYFAMIPGLGILGFDLSFGFNRIAKAIGINYKSSWAVSSLRVIDMIKEMLSNDIPALISVGRRLDIPKNNKGIRLYSDSGTADVYVKSHYMVVTAIDDEYLTVSSWGNKYRILLKDYTEYVRNPIDSLITNILYIRRL